MGCSLKAEHPRWALLSMLWAEWLSQREGRFPQESRPTGSEVLALPSRPLAPRTDHLTPGRGQQCPAGSGPREGDVTRASLYQHTWVPGWRLGSVCPCPITRHEPDPGTSVAEVTPVFGTLSFSQWPFHVLGSPVGATPGSHGARYDSRLCHVLGAHLGQLGGGAPSQWDGSQLL